MSESLLYGRELLREEIEDEWWEDYYSMLVSRPGFKKERNQYRCMRCQTLCELQTPYPCLCNKKCYYCRECIALGKVRECSLLYSLPEPNHFKQLNRPYLKWNGTLSPQQKEASVSITKSIEENEEHIVWAVAGAGKTEMLFEGLGQALEKGKRVCIASPRVDVCLELAPRIQQAFPAVSLAVLYGGAEERYRYTQLVVSTTHQLYRFKEAFDVMVIDEIDAFPYYLNQALYFATDKARKSQSSVIYLTATPDKKMRKRIKTNKIKTSILPARYHKHPLPVPKAVYQKKQFIDLHNKAYDSAVKKMEQLIGQNKRFLVFIPTISLMNKVIPHFEELFPSVLFEGVHSQDPERKEKVLKMREEKLHFLLSTTILERGVTFKNIDVIVLGADHHVYTEAALIQIAGRAGRSPEYPTGEVTFYHHGWTKPIKNAVKQIKKMNHRAKEKGYVL